jgi:hypothetical protein
MTSIFFFWAGFFFGGGFGTNGSSPSTSAVVFFLFRLRVRVEVTFVGSVGFLTVGLYGNFLKPEEVEGAGEVEEMEVAAEAVKYCATGRMDTTAAAVLGLVGSILSTGGGRIISLHICIYFC